MILGNKKDLEDKRKITYEELEVCFYLIPFTI